MAIVESSNNHQVHLRKLMGERRRLANKVLKGNHSLLRMTAADLNECIALAIVVVEKFVTERIFEKYKSAYEYFRSKNLPVNDWAGLTNQLLVSTFSEGLLQPLEEADKVFSLEINHVGIGEFFKGLKDNMPREDLDSVMAKVPLINVKKLPPFNLDLWSRENVFHEKTHGDSILSSICFFTKDRIEKKKAFDQTKAKVSAPERSSPAAQKPQEDHRDLLHPPTSDVMGLLSSEARGSIQEGIVTIDISPAEDGQAAYEDYLYSGEPL